MDEASWNRDEEEFARIIQGLRPGLGVSRELETRPALLIERLAGLHREVPIGTRARFLLTTYVDEELAAYGWRSDLRIRTPVEATVPGLDEPGVGLIEERDYYLDRGTAGIKVGVSRVWVESLVRVPAGEPTAGGPDAWMSSILENPNQPVIELLHPVARRHHMIGTRVVHARGDGRYEADLRAVASPLMSHDGILVVAVIEESQWYRWNRRTYTQADQVVGHLPAGELWVE